MKKLKLLCALVLVFVLTLTGCSSTDKSSSKNESSIAIFVNVDYVKENIDNQDVIFIDARGQEDEKTLKNAVILPWQALADVDSKPGDESFGVALDPDNAAKVLSAKGIDQNKEIIIFASTLSGWGEDGRIFWQLKTLGYKNLKIVDGGIDAILAAELETQKGTATLEPVEVKIDSVDKSTTIDTKELEALIAEKDDKLVVIDTRMPKEFAGAADYGEAKGGRIPSSINIPYNDLLDNDGFIKSDQDIIKILEDNGITKDSEIITYCTAGIRSAYFQVILNELGYNARNYDQSFYHWSAVNEVER